MGTRALTGEVLVNDRMQRGYRYARVARPGRDFDPDFAPELTPAEMLALGVFCGKYMTDCREEFPASWLPLELSTQIVMVLPAGEVLIDVAAMLTVCAADNTISSSMLETGFWVSTLVSHMLRTRSNITVPQASIRTAEMVSPTNVGTPHSCSTGAATPRAPATGSSDRLSPDSTSPAKSSSATPGPI